MIHRVPTWQQVNALQQPAENTAARQAPRQRSTPPDFSRILRAAESSQPNGKYVSPFNPLGVPPSSTLAPTAAEVAANPAKYAGTPFDPARQLNIIFPLQREEASSVTPTVQPPITPPASAEPPWGSTATKDANVFLTASGATWNRPGTVPVSATSADYDRWRLNTFGVPV